MLLTTIDRALLYLEIEDTKSNRRKLLDWVTTVSKKTTSYLQREIEIKVRTEYFDTISNRHIYFPKAIPFIGNPTLHYDTLGTYDGGEYELVLNSDYILGGQSQRRSITLLSPREPSPSGLRLTYTAGLAYHAAKSVFACTTGNGSPARGMFCLGDDTESVGILRAYGAGTCAIEVLAGYFEETESVTCYSDLDLTQPADVTFTLTASTTRSLVESNPDIVKAVEMELRYLNKHQFDFENSMSGKEGTQRRAAATVYTKPAVFQPESEALLYPYKRVYVV